ncbi:MAG: protein phosphatase 2C domain-containing protein [Hyphomicrobiaceae bacterium]|nr:protein phosphatase 2C domain-containing protein [Hyphomicrobiaceae bacterium]
MIEYEFGSASYMGARSYQEDCCKFYPMRSSKAVAGGSVGSRHAASLLAVLADGMGGHVGGALASETACKAYWTAYKRALTDDTLTTFRHALETALQSSNREIAEAVARDPSMQGMGCTLVAAQFERRGVIWTSVGDSPLYRLDASQQRVRRINDDHSLAPVLEKMVESGKLSRLDAEMHPQRNALRSALRGQRLEIIDRRTEFEELFPGDWIILSSDGLQTLSDADIAEIVLRNYLGGPQAVADALIEGVRNVGDAHQDNTTVMVVAAYEADRNGIRPRPRFGADPRIWQHFNAFTESPYALAALALGVVAVFLLTFALTLDSGSNAPIDVQRPASRSSPIDQDRQGRPPLRGEEPSPTAKEPPLPSGGGRETWRDPAPDGTGVPDRDAPRGRETELPELGPKAAPPPGRKPSQADPDD